MRALTAEQLLIIADEFCAHTHVAIRDFSALAAIAAVPGARFNGITVHTSVESAARHLEATVRRLEPLSARNEEFALAAGQVYRRWAEERYLQNRT